MILRHFNLFEPKSGDLVQDRALVRNRVGQDDVESREAVGRDEEQRFVELENFAHLAAAQLADSGEIE